jgi:hypothetical protein
LDLGDLRRWQPTENVGEIVLGIDAAPPAAEQDRVDHCAAPSRLRMTYE